MSARDAGEKTLSALDQALDRYLPDPDYRAYYRWALSAANPEQALFHRIIALTQLGNLTAAVLADLPGPDPWPVLLRWAVPVNVYQIFEVVSDNLGIGLADDAKVAVRELLLDFNEVVVHDLQHPSRAGGAELLGPLKSAADRVSAYQQSLVAAEHAQVAQHYPGRGETIEHSVWSGLVANLESGRDVLAALAGTRTEPLIRARTVERYDAVRRTLTATSLSSDELLQTGRQSILVTPTLAYFGAVFAEVLRPDPGYPATLDDGSLFAMYDTAALLLRLQNDIGSTLLELGAKAFRANIDAAPGETVLDLLRRSADVPVFNRFRKDLLNGEFNIALYSVRAATDLGVAEFEDLLDSYAELYREQLTRFEAQLSALRRRLDDHRILVVTRRFVEFHAELYRHRYDSLAGDYAI